MVGRREPFKTVYFLRLFTLHSESRQSFCQCTYLEVPKLELKIYGIIKDLKHPVVFSSAKLYYENDKLFLN